MSEVKVDIDYSSDGEETTFSANTPAGEDYLDGPSLTLPITEAQQFIAAS